MKTNFCVEGSLKHTIGIASNGGWAEYVKVHVSLVAKVPDEVLLNQGIIFFSSILPNTFFNFLINFYDFSSFVRTIIMRCSWIG